MRAGSLCVLSVCVHLGFHRLALGVSAFQGQAVESGWESPSAEAHLFSVVIGGGEDANTQAKHV